MPKYLLTHNCADDDQTEVCIVSASTIEAALPLLKEQAQKWLDATGAYDYTIRDFVPAEYYVGCFPVIEKELPTTPEEYTEQFAITEVPYFEVKE